MAKGQKVFIIEHAPDLIFLFDLLLREAGYEMATGEMHADLMDEIKRFDPDVVVVDLMPDHASDLALLDKLRTDPATRGTPLVAMSTLPDALDQAVASYNVRQILLKPFDVEDLKTKIRAAIEHEPLLALLRAPQPPASPLFGEMATGLTAASRAMVIRWVQRVATNEPHKSRRLDLIHAIDHMPILIGAVCAALRSDNFRVALTQDSAIREKVGEHVELRRNEGIPLIDIVREYQYMREEIQCESARILQDKGATAGEILEVVNRQDFALDTIIRLVIDAYEELEVAK